MRLLYLLVWDAMFCIVLSISHFASATLISPDSSYIVHCFCHASGAVFGARAISRTDFKYAAPPAAGRHFSGAGRTAVPRYPAAALCRRTHSRIHAVAKIPTVSNFCISRSSPENFGFFTAVFSTAYSVPRPSSTRVSLAYKEIFPIFP